MGELCDMEFGGRRGALIDLGGDMFEKGVGGEYW